MIRSDLQRATEYFDKHFYHKMRLNFSSVLLKYYDKKLVEIVKSINFNCYALIKISLRLGLVFWLMSEALSSEQKKDYVPSPSTINNASFSNLFSSYRITRRSPKLINTIDISAPIDVDYDMELAEVNVFRPLFRYHASYTRKGSTIYIYNQQQGVMTYLKYNKFGRRKNKENNCSRLREQAKTDDSNTR
ncbi:hypothetical protein GQX74_010632 [Glossina fuscipes]|nr:hypothetical protein GQX74_010632 [Glossina fuscipes]